MEAWISAALVFRGKVNGVKLEAQVATYINSQQEFLRQNMTEIISSGKTEYIVLL